MLNEMARNQLSEDKTRRKKRDLEDKETNTEEKMAKHRVTLGKLEVEEKKVALEKKRLDLERERLCLNEIMSFSDILPEEELKQHCTTVARARVQELLMEMGAKFTEGNDNDDDNRPNEVAPVNQQEQDKNKFTEIVKYSADHKSTVVVSEIKQALIDRFKINISSQKIKKYVEALYNNEAFPPVYKRIRIAEPEIDGLGWTNLYIVPATAGV